MRVTKVALVVKVVLLAGCATNPASMTREYGTSPQAIHDAVIDLAVSRGWIVDRETDSMVVVIEQRAIGDVVYQVRAVPAAGGSSVTANIYNDDPRMGRQPMYSSTYEAFFADIDASL